MIYKGMLQIDKKDYDGAVATFNQGYAMIEATRKEVSVADMSLIGDTMQMVNARVLLLNNRGWAHSENKKYELAIGDFTRASLLDPKYARALLNRAITYERRGELDKAIEDYNDVVQMVPNFAKGFNNRGKILFQKGMLDQAIKDYSEAIRLDPTFTLAYNNRRIAWEAKGDWTSLSEELNKLVKGNAPSIDDVNAMAWLSATCPQEVYRNGELAVRLAKSVCEATAWKSPGMLDTLAAAYAEAGDFSSAVETQTKALAMATEMQRGDYQARLKLYQENKPFRVPSK